jgi:quercetin dioxygenase-like cupin family protein
MNVRQWRKLPSLGLLAFGLSALVPPRITMGQAAEHEHSTAASPAEIEVDNDQVQVLRVRIAPYAVIPMHDITERVVIWLTAAHLKIIHPDGTAREIQINPGEVGWATPGRHEGRNLSDQPIEFIAVIPKKAGERSSHF